MSFSNRLNQGRIEDYEGVDKMHAAMCPLVRTSIDMYEVKIYI